MGGRRRGDDVPSEHASLITSRDNRWIKAFRGALRGTGPRASEPIGVEGPKMIEDALRSGLEAEALLVGESGEADAHRILRVASESEAGVARSRVLRTTDKIFESIAGTESPQGVAALFRQPEWAFEDVLRGAGEMRESAPLVAVIAAVQDPGNVGTIARSAEAFGATGLVATRGSADPWSPKALRASAGSALRLPLLRGMAIPILIAQLRIAGVKVYAAASRHDSAGNVSGILEGVDLRGPSAIFIGNEGSGLPDEALRSADGVISIPTKGSVESLNAGIAASIVLYEAARQRKLEGR